MDDIETQIISLKNNGMLKKDIAKKLLIEPKQLWRIFKRLGLSYYKDRSKYLTEENMINICTSYTNNATIRQIQTSLGCSVQDIRKALKQNNIPPKTLKDYRQIGYNETAFEDINSEETNYFYGWILSDGCLTKDCIRININSKDSYIIEQLKVYVGTSNKIGCYTYEDSRSITGKLFNTTSLYFKHEGIIARLKSFGLEERKSTKEKSPKVLENNRHFWRGMLDGDGNISKSTNEVSLVGSEEIINSFVRYCTSLFPKCTPKIYIKGSLYIFSLCSKIYSKLLLDELYRDCNYKLDRKYQIYLGKYYGSR